MSTSPVPPWKLDPDPLRPPDDFEEALQELVPLEHRKAFMEGFRDRETARDFAKSRMLGGYLVAAAIVVLAVIAVVLLVGRGS